MKNLIKDMYTKAFIYKLLPNKTFILSAQEHYLLSYIFEGITRDLVEQLDETVSIHQSCIEFSLAFLKSDGDIDAFKSLISKFYMAKDKICKETFKSFKDMNQRKNRTVKEKFQSVIDNYIVEEYSQEYSQEYLLNQLKNQPDKKLTFSFKEYYLIDCLLEQLNEVMKNDTIDEPYRLNSTFCFDENEADVQTFNSLMHKVFHAKDISINRSWLLNRTKGAVS